MPDSLTASLGYLCVHMNLHGLLINCQTFCGKTKIRSYSITIFISKKMRRGYKIRISCLPFGSSLCASHGQSSIVVLPPMNFNFKPHDSQPTSLITKPLPWVPSHILFHEPMHPIRLFPATYLILAKYEVNNSSFGF